MSIAKNVTGYLKKTKTAFEVVAHRTVFTAYDLAATLREKLEGIGKTLLIKTDKGFVLVVMPANRRLDLAKLKKVLGAKKLSIAAEKDMVAALKVKPGALTPFGVLHSLDVLADTSLLKTREVLLGAGSFTESLRMKAKDFVKLERVQLGQFTVSADLPNPIAKIVKKKLKRPSAKKNKTGKRKKTS